MQDDLEVGTVVLQVVSSTAVLTGSKGSVNGSTDSVQVAVDGRSAAMDISLMVTPTTVHNAGALCRISRCTCTT